MRTRFSRDLSSGRDEDVGYGKFGTCRPGRTNGGTHAEKQEDRARHIGSSADPRCRRRGRGGQRRVTETEVGDEEGAYEVEVTLDNGTETDVHLDKNFTVLGSEAESGDESESGSDD